MARPDYRKRKGDKYFLWHFCANCHDWPTHDYETRDDPGGSLCDNCQQLERTKRCR